MNKDIFCKFDAKKKIYIFLISRLEEIFLDRTFVGDSTTGSPSKMKYEIFVLRIFPSGRKKKIIMNSHLWDGL